MITIETSMDLVRIVLKNITTDRTLSEEDVDRIVDEVGEIVKDWKHKQKLLAMKKLEELLPTGEVSR